MDDRCGRIKIFQRNLSACLRAVRKGKNTMPSILWTGKLSLSMKLMVNASSILAWINGSTKDTNLMKQRVKQGYNGDFTDHVTRYDELGLELQIKAARAQLEGLDVVGKRILDVGAGTGALSFIMLEKGAARVTCGDISEYMLSQARKKAAGKGYGEDKIDFQTLDAESLPFKENSFDIVMTGMTLGLLPDQLQAVKEMVRVVKPGGIVSVGAHGPEHYWEPTDAFFRAISKRYLLGYRLEFWPRSEKEIRRLMMKAGLSNIHVKREIWRTQYPDGGGAFDFFTAISSSWWYEKFPKEKRSQDYQKVRNYFIKNHKNQVTDDIILAYGWK